MNRLIVSIPLLAFSGPCTIPGPNPLDALATLEDPGDDVPAFARGSAAVELSMSLFRRGPLGDLE